MRETARSRLSDERDDYVLTMRLNISRNIPLTGTPARPGPPCADRRTEITAHAPRGRRGRCRRHASPRRQPLHAAIYAESSATPRPVSAIHATNR
eukprot:6397426-Prymnesium_polylepis.2